MTSSEIAPGFNVEPYENQSPGITDWHTGSEARGAYTYVPAGALPMVGSQDPLARVKLFDPTGSWTWYLSEFDPDPANGGLAFGLVVGFEVELGYVSLDELAAVRGRLGLPMERDVHFKPAPLAELRDQALASRGGR
jgi:hypothetical protein